MINFQTILPISLKGENNVWKRSVIICSRDVISPLLMLAGVEIDRNLLTLAIKSWFVFSLAKSGNYTLDAL